MRHDSLTQNAAPAYSTTGSSLLDFFAQAGASRANPHVAVNLFKKAYKENPLAAIRLAFYFRDPRGGQGERAVFRGILRSIAKEHPKLAGYLASYVPAYGRWDDLISLRGTEAWDYALSVWVDAINQGDGLACKWSPREKSAQKEAALDLMRALHFTPAKYRRHIARYTKVVENQMCAKQWGEINFNHVPSQALLKYRSAFYKHEPERFPQWIEDVRSNKKTTGAKANVSTLLPHQFIRALNLISGWSVRNYSWLSRENIQFLDTMWNELLEHYGTVEYDILPVIDVSGSMYSGAQDVMPIEVSVGLGLFLSEMIQGRWNRKFITFSAHPEIVSVAPNSDIAMKLIRIAQGQSGLNTDIAAVMRLLANTFELTGTEPPSIVLIISDMQFDSNSRESSSNRGSYGTGFENAVELFKSRNLRIPRFIWWNVNNSNGLNFQIHLSDLRGVQTAYVSGFSPITIKGIVEVGDLDPMLMVNHVLDKYQDIVVPEDLLYTRDYNTDEYRQLVLPF